MTPEQLAARIRTIPDFPKPGVVFRDITTLLRDPEAYAAAIDAMSAPIKLWTPDMIVGIESRGFIFGAPIARDLGIGFVPVRKLGKLPADTISIEYDLEYGKNVLEIHRDALKPGERVVIVDDVLATGGTVAGTLRLVEQLGAEVVGISFLAELPALGGRARLPDGIVSAIIPF
ncbi:MAG: adenine phosphoribosyltransferase [Candidatus Limnocylindrus sp.]